MFNSALIRRGEVRFVLASASPRRRSILKQTLPDMEFEIRPSSAEENLDKSDYKSDPSKYAIDTARLKAKDIFEKIRTEEMVKGGKLVVIGGDTIVTYKGVIYEKPPSKEAAVSTLKALSGQTHQVYTGVVILDNLCEDGVNETSFAVGTGVTFDQLTDDLIRDYVETGEPMDKAGGYGIQARGSVLVEKIDGCYFNVEGFPVHRFAKALRKILAKADGR